jgi:short-subunit dehydrogenase
MKQNKTVLITGATSGIGLELAKLFAKDNYNIIIVARDKQELNDTFSKLSGLTSGKIIPIAKDLFQTDAAFELYSEVKQQGINVDVLVNNAGQGQYGEFTETDIKRQLDIIQLNISSLVALTYQYLKDFVAKGEGKILNLSSIASKTPGPWQSVYHGTKAFIQSFTEAIRSEVKEKGITITALLPGVTDTDFFNKADMNKSKIVQDKDKMSDPADVAKDGYDALMKGKDMVISGIGNKLQVAMDAVMPDEQLADTTNKKQAPVTKK